MLSPRQASDTLDYLIDAKHWIGWYLVRISETILYPQYTQVLESRRSHIDHRYDVKKGQRYCCQKLIYYQYPYCDQWCKVGLLVQPLTFLPLTKLATILTFNGSCGTKNMFHELTPNITGKLIKATRN